MRTCVRRHNYASFRSMHDIKSLLLRSVLDKIFPLVKAEGLEILPLSVLSLGDRSYW